MEAQQQNAVVHDKPEPQQELHSDDQCEKCCIWFCEKTCNKHPFLMFIVWTILILAFLTIPIVLTLHNYDEPHDAVCGYGYMLNYTTSYKCICFSFYGKDYDNVTTDALPCNYQKYSKTTASLLQWFFGFAGAGLFYIHFWWLAIIQAVACGMIVLFLILMALDGGKSDIDMGTGFFLLGFCAIIVLAWLVTACMVSANSIPDGSGFKLA